MTPDQIADTLCNVPDDRFKNIKLNNQIIGGLHLQYIDCGFSRAAFKVHNYVLKIARERASYPGMSERPGSYFNKKEYKTWELANKNCVTDIFYYHPKWIWMLCEYADQKIDYHDTREQIDQVTQHLKNLGVVEISEFGMVKRNGKNRVVSIDYGW